MPANPKFWHFFDIKLGGMFFYVHFSFLILALAIPLDGKVPNLEEVALLQNVGVLH